MWENKHRISKRALNELLPVLQRIIGEKIPKNYHTLQRTPANTDIANVAGGQLWHNGLRNCLLKHFEGLSSNLTISLNSNIDGLPIYRSSKLTLWPILASIFG